MKPGLPRAIKGSMNERSNGHRPADCRMAERYEYHSAQRREDVGRKRQSRGRSRLVWRPLRVAEFAPIGCSDIPQNSRCTCALSRPPQRLDPAYKAKSKSRVRPTIRRQLRSRRGAQGLCRGAAPERGRDGRGSGQKAQTFPRSGNKDKKSDDWGKNLRTRRVTLGALSTHVP
jgi:hypothetical protein